MKMAAHVAELRQLLGDDVLLLPWPWGKKGDRRPWGHLTLEAMSDPAHLRKLGLGNIGVALGRASGGLCSLDIDRDEEMECFLKLNPEICNTLRSRGSRGCNFWWRMDGPYPGLKPIKRNRMTWGEWRSNGAQTIIHGQHPEGHDYQIINRVSPVRIKFIQIQWPEGIFPLLQGGSLPKASENPEPPRSRKNRTDASEATHASHANHASDATNDTKAAQEVRAQACVSLSVEFPYDLIAKLIPQEAHTNHNLLFDLAREVRTFEEGANGRYRAEELRGIFDRWYVKAKAHVRNDQSEDEYFMEFMKAYLRVKYLIGQDVFHEVMARACRSDPPREVTAVIKHPGIRLLATLCRELQKLWGDEPFFLSCRTIEKEFQVSLSTASLWLHGLEGCGFIKTITKGDSKTMQASRFRYLLPL